MLACGLCVFPGRPCLRAVKHSIELPDLERLDELLDRCFTEELQHCLTARRAHVSLGWCIGQHFIALRQNGLFSFILHLGLRRHQMDPFSRSHVSITLHKPVRNA